MKPCKVVIGLVIVDVILQFNDSTFLILIRWQLLRHLRILHRLLPHQHPPLHHLSLPCLLHQPLLHHLHLLSPMRIHRTRELPLLHPHHHNLLLLLTRHLLLWPCYRLHQPLAGTHRHHQLQPRLLLSPFHLPHLLQPMFHLHLQIPHLHHHQIHQHLQGTHRHHQLQPRRHLSPFHLPHLL